MSLGKAAKEVGKSVGEMMAIKSPKLIQFIQDNPLLVTILFAIGVVAVVFLIYKIFKRD